MATATKGVHRNLDELGRIVIPKEYREQLGINKGEAVEIIRVGDAIRIRPHREKACGKCNGTGLA